MHLARKLKMAKPNLSNHSNFIRHYKPNMECSNVNVASTILMEPVGLIDNSSYSIYTLLYVTISTAKIDLILITEPILCWLSQSQRQRLICS